MEIEKLTRHTRDDQMDGWKGRIAVVLGSLRSGGLSLVFEVPEERISRMEQQGFNHHRVQGHLDVLERTERQGEAAMLRGAFNDLLTRLEAVEEHKPLD